MSLNGVSVPPQQYSMYTKTNGQNSAAQPTINRYVAFDPYAPPPAQTQAPAQALAQAAPVQAQVQHQHTPSPPPSLPPSSLPPSLQSSYEPYQPATVPSAVTASPSVFPSMAPTAPLSSNFSQPPQIMNTATSSSIAHNIFQDRAVETKLETQNNIPPSFAAYTPPSTSAATAASAPIIDTFLTSKPAEFVPIISSDSSQDEFCEVEIVGSNSSSVL